MPYRNPAIQTPLLYAANLSQVQSDVFPPERLQFLLPSCRHYWGTLPLASLRRAYVHLGVSVHQSLFTSQSEHWSLLNATRRRSRYQGHEFNEAFLYHSKRGNWHTISFFNLVDPPRCPGQIRNLRSIKSASWGQDLLPKQTEGRTKFRLQK